MSARTRPSDPGPPPYAPLPPDDRPRWEQARVAWSRLLECLRGRPATGLATDADYHRQLTEALADVGAALQALGLQDCMDQCDYPPGHGSYARNLLQLTRGPSPEAVGRLLTQDAREPAFFDWMRRDIQQFAEKLLAATRPRPESLLDPGSAATTPGTATRVKVVRDKKREDRDRWIYQQCCKGTPHDVIVADLRRIALLRGWSVVRSKQRVQQIGSEYARRHERKPPPPRRDL